MLSEVLVLLTPLRPSSCVETLLAAGAAVDMVAAGGQTPLFLACEAGRLDCTQALLNAGADRWLTTAVSLCATLAPGWASAAKTCDHSYFSVSAFILLFSCLLFLLHSPTTSAHFVMF